MYEHGTISKDLDFEVGIAESAFGLVEDLRWREPIAVGWVPSGSVE